MRAMTSIWAWQRGQSRPSIPRVRISRRAQGSLRDLGAGVSMTSTSAMVSGSAPVLSAPVLSA